MDYNLLGSSVHGDSPGKNTGVDCHALLQGIFPTQGLNPGLPHCRQILYQLSHKGSPRILEWVAYPFSRGSSQSRNWTEVSCLAGGFFTSWATREVHKVFCKFVYLGVILGSHLIKGVLGLILEILLKSGTYLEWVRLFQVDSRWHCVENIHSFMFLPTQSFLSKDCQELGLKNDWIAIL